MGLFGGSDDGGYPRTTDLVMNARGGSITGSVLTTTSRRLKPDYIDDRPVIELLGEEEQPHYYFGNVNAGISRDGVTTGAGNSIPFISFCVITDERVLLITSGTSGESLPYEALERINMETGKRHHQISFTTEDAEYRLPVVRKSDTDEMEAAVAYMRRRIADDEQTSDSIDPIDGLNRIWEIAAADSVDSLNADPQGAYVTAERVRKISDVLNPDEVVHYLTKGSTVDTEGAGSGSSLFGNDRSRKSGTRGWVRAAITDQRTVVKIPQVLGDDERSIGYDNITSVDVDTGLVNKRLTLHTAGPTYHVEVQEPNKQEVSDAAGFIRRQVSEANQPTVVQTESSEPSASERLRELKDLHDDGLITDEEFEDKRAGLVDEL